jgi:hypothetical protein
MAGLAWFGLHARHHMVASPEEAFALQHRRASH